MQSKMTIKVFKGSNFEHTLQQSYDYLLELAKHDKHFYEQKRVQKAEMYQANA